MVMLSLNCVSTMFLAWPKVQLSVLSSTGADTNLLAIGELRSTLQIGSTPAGSGSALTKMRAGAVLK